MASACGVWPALHEVPLNELGREGTTPANVRPETTAGGRPREDPWATRLSFLLEP
jgi:hypothetical protein